MRFQLLSQTVVVISALALGIASAQPMADRDLGPKLSETALVRAASLAADPASIIPFPWSNDPLEGGWIEVRGRRHVKVELDGALPDAVYSVEFCKLASPAGCAAIGDAPTDSRGRADQVLSLPDSISGPQAGFFVLRRAGNTMFVSGFEVTAPPPPALPAPVPSAIVSVKGTIASLTPPAALTVAGFPLPVVTDSKTKFHAGISYAELVAGMDVEVSGSVTSAGVLLATAVRARR